VRVLLLHPERPFDLEAPQPPNADALVQDLELDTVLDAMAGGDMFLREVSAACLLDGLRDPAAILHRQAALRDALERPDVVRALYDLAVDALASKREIHFFWFRDSAEGAVRKSVQMLGLLLERLERLRALADEHAGSFRSEAFERLFATVQRELDDEYLARLAAELHDLEFPRGILASARLGRGNRGTDFVLLRPNERSLLERISPQRPRTLGFSVPARDEGGLDALADLRSKALARAAAALAQATDHVLGFFAQLRTELAFYVACLNLEARLSSAGRPVCFPEPRPLGERAFSARGLYDVPLALHLDGEVVGNDVNGDGKSLVVVTGANQGGKSTFLRSVGVAQLMFQAGMFVGAESLTASVANGVHTHYAREEDVELEHGKLDEELARMSEIVGRIEPGALLLCNESFSSTNEYEGSELARQLVHALLDAGVNVVFVTHLFDLARSLCEEGRDDALFLRAERGEGGRRTYKLVESEPLPTSHAADSYRRVFGHALSV
jgi:DNA mismatch repair ATPase MutS